MADLPFPTCSDDPNSLTSPETGDIAPTGQPPWLERGPRLSSPWVEEEEEEAQDNGCSLDLAIVACP
jgi:hypothetical protein